MATISTNVVYYGTNWSYLYSRKQFMNFYFCIDFRHYKLVSYILLYKRIIYVKKEQKIKTFINIVNASELTLDQSHGVFI